MTLGLYEAAHHTEAHERRAVLHDERGNDRVEGPFAGRVNVGMAGFEGEGRAAILQGEAEAVLGERDGRVIGKGGVLVEVIGLFLVVPNARTCGRQGIRNSG